MDCSVWDKGRDQRHGKGAAHPTGGDAIKHIQRRVPGQRWGCHTHKGGDIGRTMHRPSQTDSAPIAGTHDDRRICPEFRSRPRQQIRLLRDRGPGGVDPVGIAQSRPVKRDDAVALRQARRE